MNQGIVPRTELSPSPGPPWVHIAVCPFFTTPGEIPDQVLKSAILLECSVKWMLLRIGIEPLEEPGIRDDEYVVVELLLNRLAEIQHVDISLD